MAVEKSAELIRLVSAFDRSEKTKDIARESLEFLKDLNCRAVAANYHNKLCNAMLKAINGGGQEYAELLRFCGPVQTVVVIHSNITGVVAPVARWLTNEVSNLLTSDNFTSDLFLQCSQNPSPRLTPAQDHLVGVVCRLPALLANRLGRHLPGPLLPPAYFKQIGKCLLTCLEMVHTSIKESCDCSLVFLASLLGKAALVGSRDSLMSMLVASLEVRASRDPLWSKIAQTLFSHIPTSSLEQVLESLVHLVTPSLLPNCPLRCLIGELGWKNQKAKFILSHKLILVRVPSSPHAAHTLIGYLSATEHAQKLLVKSLQSALEVWSDGSALRHMDVRQHLWLSRIIVLSFSCLKEKEITSLRPKIQHTLMSGVQAHLDDPLPDVRHIGMAVGECVFNKLNREDSEHQLKFEYETNDEIAALKLLARSISEQEKDLDVLREKAHSISDNKAVSCGEQPVEDGKAVAGVEERFGEGYVQATECSDTDSDDDLVPFAMSNDPDSSVPEPPRYLRTLIKVLASSDSSPLQLDGALKVAADMIKSRPSDLREVSVEVAKLLLHLSDSYSLDDFVSLRLSAMVALVVCSPDLVTPYLTNEFYAPNYSLRQRMDILEVLSSAAMELSQPADRSDDFDIKKKETKRAESEVGGVSSLLRKPWEDIIRERVKSKTRIISKGPSKASPKPVPNRFAKVAHLFFFPLMNQFDRPVNTLDLLGQDSLVLGNLLYTLGTVMYAATNIPLAPAMSASLLDFLWALKYHPTAYIRQGVLFALSMLVAATPPHTLLEGMGAGLSEAVLWVKDLCHNEPDAQCRSLAQHTMAMLSAVVKPVTS